MRWDRLRREASLPPTRARRQVFVDVCERLSRRAGKRPPAPFVHGIQSCLRGEHPSRQVATVARGLYRRSRRPGGQVQSAQQRSRFPSSRQFPSCHRPRVCGCASRRGCRTDQRIRNGACQCEHARQGQGTQAAGSSSRHPSHCMCPQRSKAPSGEFTHSTLVFLAQELGVLAGVICGAPITRAPGTGARREDNDASRAGTQRASGRPLPGTAADLPPPRPAAAPALSSLLRADAGALGLRMGIRLARSSRPPSRPRCRPRA
jgi:hypothetical protein